MPENINILVTGVGGPAGINAVKLLSQQSDITIYAVDTDLLSAGQFFAHHFFQVPLVADYDNYSLVLQGIVKKYNIHAILPTVSEELIVIRRALEGINVKIVLSPQLTLELCHDKRLLYTWMDENFLEYMVKWQTLDVREMWEDQTYFIKPSHGRGARGCRRVARSEIAYWRELLSPRKEWLIMEDLPGTEWTVDAYVTSSGRISMNVPRERLALSGGISLKGRTVKEAKVIYQTEAVIKKLPFYGPICFQWKADKNNEPKLVEINPRLAGGVAISALAGADPMQCLIQELRCEKSPIIDWKEVTVIRYFEEKIYENTCNRSAS